MGGCGWTRCPRNQTLSHVAQDTARSWFRRAGAHCADFGAFWRLFGPFLGHIVELEGTKGPFVTRKSRRTCFWLFCTLTRAVLGENINIYIYIYIYIYVYIYIYIYTVPRVRPWRGRGRWPVLLAFYGGEGRPGSCGLPAPSHLCWCCVVAASSPVVRARARWSWGREGTRAGAQEHEHGFTVAGVLCSVHVMFPGACPCALRTGGRAAQPAGVHSPGRARG